MKRHQQKLAQHTARLICDMLPDDNVAAVATLALSLYKVAIDRGMMVPDDGESAKLFLDSFMEGFTAMARGA